MTDEATSGEGRQAPPPPNSLFTGDVPGPVRVAPQRPSLWMITWQVPVCYQFTLQLGKAPGLGGVAALL